MRYSVNDIRKITGGEFVNTPADRNLSVGSVFTDSRSTNIRPDSVFFAISGRNNDGHAFINELYSRGIRVFVIERDVNTNRYPDAVFILVESSVAALQELAADYRSKFAGKVVAVTGSNGKTIVKEWIAQLAPTDVKLFRSPKSYNSQIGVPLSLLLMEGDEDIAVIEAGISERGEMDRLERIIRPDVGIITMIGDAHQENFRSLGEKLSEKLILFRGAATVICGDDDAIYSALERKYPLKEIIRAREMEADRFSFADKASCQNASIAAAFWEYEGVSPGRLREMLKNLIPVAMRLEIREGYGNSLLLNDYYNSDINSLSIALDHLENVAGDRPRTLIISDIMQSGYHAADLYAKVAGMVNRSGIGRMIGIGSGVYRFGGLFTTPDSSFYLSTEEFLASAGRHDFTGNAILLKGSRDARFERIANLLECKKHTTVMEIDLDAMAHNLNVHRALTGPGTGLMAMVKASGYGTGNYEVARMLESRRVDYLAVAFADEGVVLREAGITMPIVVLNADSDSFEEMIRYRLEPEIYSFTSLDAFAGLLRRHGEVSYPIHIKLDTGMHRLGFEEKETDLLAAKLDSYRSLVKIATVFSHLAASDEPEHDEFTQWQVTLFESMSGRIAAGIGYRPLRHIANSAAITRFPQAEFDMVRLGLGLYGFGDGTLDLRPVSRLVTRIVQIKELHPGETVGYGRAGVINKITRVATIPVGYADGLDRRLGCGNWKVAAGGMLCPTIGRICMDTCMIDVSGADVREGDEVVVFGGGGDNSVTAMSKGLRTIPYEIMTSISGRVKRVFVKE